MGVSECNAGHLFFVEFFCFRSEKKEEDLNACIYINYNYSLDLYEISISGRGWDVTFNSYTITDLDIGTSRLT